MNFSKSARNILLVVLAIVIQAAVSYKFFKTDHRGEKAKCRDVFELDRQMEQIRVSLFEEPENSLKKIVELQRCEDAESSYTFTIKLSLLKTALYFHSGDIGKGRAKIAEFLEILEQADQVTAEEVGDIATMYLFKAFQGAGGYKKKTELCAPLLDKFRSTPENNNETGVIGALKIFFYLRCNFELAHYDDFQWGIGELQNFRDSFFKKNPSVYDIQMKLNLLVFESRKYQFKYCLVASCRSRWGAILKDLRSLGEELSIYFNRPTVLSDLDVLELKGLVTDARYSEARLLLEKMKERSLTSRRKHSRFRLEVALEELILSGLTGESSEFDFNKLYLKGTGSDFSEFYSLVLEAVHGKSGRAKILKRYQKFEEGVGENHFLVKRFHKIFSLEKTASP